MVLTAQRLYIIFMTLYTNTEGEKSTDVNVEVLSAASALRECLMVVSRGRNKFDDLCQKWRPCKLE